MKRSLVLALVLMFAPAMASAQVEIGLDAGFQISNSSEDGVDNTNSFTLPTSTARVGFAAGEQFLVETLLGFNWASQGDASGSSLVLMPGLDFLVGEMFYVRGEAGLSRVSYDFGTGSGSDSQTQYAFGGAVGLRKMLGDGAVFRAEAGVDRWLEVTENNVVTEPARTDIRIGVGVSAVIN